MNPLLGIALKLASTVAFTLMVACVKAVATEVPTGEIVFSRSFFGLLPVLAFLAWRGELASALTTKRLSGHAWRGLAGSLSMALWFTSLALLPWPEAMAIGYATPLVITALAAIVLGEVVRSFRWTAVVVGFLGVMVVLAPRLGEIGAAGPGGGEMIGAACALGSAFTAALAVILVRGLITTETTASIVVYFSLTASGFALLTLPFGWVVPNGWQAGLLLMSGLLGGVGQLLMTESYRYAEASTIAPFDYTAMLWGLALAWLMFGEVPTGPVLIGSVIIIAAGIAIILRERHLRQRG